MQGSLFPSTCTGFDGPAAPPCSSSPLRASTSTRYNDSLPSPFSTFDLENTTSTSFILLNPSDASLSDTPADQDFPPPPHLLGPDDLAVLGPLDLAGCPQSTPVRRRRELRPSSSLWKKGA
ncbi:hypothetical protein EHS25_000373 [Saitozyma podzolica]|uniref:Uncharacterized protein n=1 Tax=Saitozyma podzolica TaxID=1890683 RepID=A0A427YW74_9TREE|nr:hypothetical protein EHS25_000373 [Saitozyma podzolica]